MPTEAVIPSDLAVVQAFVNTYDVEEARDDIGTPEALGAFLADHGLAAPDERFEAEDVFRAHAFREALRALLFHNNGEPLDPEAVAIVNRAAEEAPLLARIDASGKAALAPGRDGFAGVTAKLLAAIARADTEGTWQRLKACSAETCKWAFYDHSRNRSRSWCSMGVCGNRAKARNYRQRRKTA
jgi:predicted RNA-binding Zn ribbon-like protein